MFEEVNEIVVQQPDLPFIAGRLAEPVQPNLLRMRALLSASKHNIVLVDGIENVSIVVFVFCCFSSCSSIMFAMRVTTWSWNCTNKQSRS